jgi:hypothetical protein
VKGTERALDRLTAMTELRSRPILGLLAFLLLAACTSAPGASTPPASPGSSQAPSASPAPSGTPTASPSPSATPSGVPNASQVVVRIEQLGGFLAPQATLQMYPSVAVYADGRVITQGPQIDLYPGPALPNLLVTHITQHGLDQILQWAQDAGLTGEDRFLGRPMPDAGNIVFTVVTADGVRHTTTVADLTGSDAEITAVRRFQDVMLNLRSWLADDIASDETPYVYDRLRVISSPADPNTLPDPGLATTRDWPLAPIDTLGQPMTIGEGFRCAVIAGDDLATLLPAAQEANQLTLWQSGDQLYQLILHPLLPDDEDCPTTFME